MALTALQLAAALRLGDGQTALTEPTAGILNRLLGVAQAVVEQHAEDAPEAVKDEAEVRLASYLYDQPTAAANMQFSAAFRNSGALSLLSPWVVRRAQRVGEPSASRSTETPTPTPTGGLDEAAVQALIAAALTEHTALANAHHTPTPTPTGGLDEAQVRALISDPAEEGNADLWPTDKLTLPDASEAVKGIVRGVTQTQAQAASGTTFLAWTQNRLRELIQVALPTVSNGDIDTMPTSQARRVFTIAKVIRAATSILPSWITNASEQIPANKLGNAVAAGSPTFTELATATIGATATQTVNLNADLRSDWNSGTYWAFLFQMNWSSSATLKHQTTALIPIRTALAATHRLRIRFTFDDNDVSAEGAYLQLQANGTVSSVSTSTAALPANANISIQGMN